MSTPITAKEVETTFKAEFAALLAKYDVSPTNRCEVYVEEGRNGYPKNIMVSIPSIWGGEGKEYDCQREFADVALPTSFNATDISPIVEKTPEFVLLKGVTSKNIGDRFFSSFKKGDEPTKSATGETWYEVLGYADTVEEAQMKLYGRIYK